MMLGVQMQSGCQDSLSCRRFYVYQKLKEIVRFDSPSSNVQNKNMIFQIFCGILWEVPWKVSEFFDSHKIFFQTVNRQILQWEIYRNYPGCGKISLKIITTFLMLIMRLDKSHGILIVGSIKIDKILPKSAKLKIICEVDWRIESIRSWIEIEEGSFLTSLHLLKNLG